MQLPLQVSYDALIKKKIQCSNLHWIGEGTDNVYAVGTHHVGKIQLSSGNTTKVSKLGNILKEVVALNNTYNGSYIYGMLCSGDLFFWNQKDNSLKHAKGIPELVTHLPSEGTEQHEGRLHAIYTAFRQTQHQNSEQNEEHPDINSHLKPKIFASFDCSSVIVILGSLQVYVWERNENASEKDNICGSWSVVACPSNIPMPSLQSKETQISLCFSSDEPFRKHCHVTFSFVDGASLMATTLTLQWGMSTGLKSFPVITSAFWNNVSVLFRKMAIEEEISQKPGVLVSQYAHNQSFMCVAINLSRYPASKLIYLHPFSKTSLIIAVGKVNGHFSSLTRSHWVSDLSWSHDNTYLAGCLRSGSIFLATRMGTLLTISCPDLPQQLQPSMLLPLHSSPTSLLKETADEEDSPNSSFHVSFHPKNDILLLSSAVRVSVLTLPDNGVRDAEVADQLVVSANHALYILSNSALTHDYAYIHCSNWRLARSVADLTQNDSVMRNPTIYEVKLWEAENMQITEGEKQQTMPVSEGEQLIRNVIDPLFAAWIITLTHKKPQLQEWRERAQNIANLLIRLVKILMQASADDDQIEHQAQLLQMLQLFHCFVRVLDLWPSSLHMLKPSLWLTHNILHTFLKCEKHAGEGSMVDTLLILSQTLSCVEETFSEVYTFDPKLTYSKSSVYGAIEPMADAEVTNIRAIATRNCKETSSRSSLIAFKMKSLWHCLYKSARKLYLRIQEQKYNEKVYRKIVLILNIVQSSLNRYSCSLHPNRNHYRGGHKLYLNGMINNAVEVWKSDIIAIILKKENKNVGKRLHSILYSLLLNYNFPGISSFLSWIYSILKSKYFTLYMSQSSPVINRLCSTPKLEKKADQITPKMKYLELSGIAMENSGRQAEQMNEKSFGSLDTEQQFSSKNSDSYPYCKVSEKRQKAFILAVRKLFGSIGRVMMAAVLHKNIIIPSPNNPHIIPPFWTPPEDVKVRGEEILAAEVTNRAIHQALWSTKTAAQALAIAGYWFDLTAFAQELGDTRISLVASLIATSDFTGKDRRNLGPESLHPASLMKSCLLGVNPHQEINSSVFYSCHELFQLASMTRINILPEIMLHCLKKIKEKVNCLDLKVQRDIYLPAPPVFCPQLFGDDIVKNNESRQISRSDELQLRNEISGWVRLFSTIISASGIAQPLLQESCKYKANEEVEIKQYHELLSLADYLGPVESGIDMTDVSEWPRIFQMWAEFLKQLWILQIRDKLWLCVRKYTISSSQHKKKNFHEKKVLEILLLCEKLYRLAESSNWKEEIVALTLTLAGNAPPCTAVAETLARIIMQPSKLPSLVKDRANRLFEQWKNIVVDIPDFADKKVNAKKKLFAANIRSDLYRIFENACTTALQSNNFTSSEENEQSNSLCSEYTVTTLFESPNEDFRKLLTLYANMTFRKDAENFPHHCTQVPNVPEFSEVIRRRELQSLSLKKILLWIEGNDTSPDYTAFELSDKIVSGDMKEKKGFFRNTGMCQRNSRTTILIRSKENTKSLSRSRSLSPDHRQTMGYNNDYSISRELCTDRYPQKYHRKSRNSKQNSVNRNRHRSLSLRKKQHIASLCKRSNSLCTLDTKDSSNSMLCENISSEVPLNLFLSLNQHLLYSLENKDNMMNLLHWILRRERKLCLSSSANQDEKCMLLKKVDLSIQDLVLAYAWEFIKETTTLRIDNAESVRLPIRKTNQSKIKKIPKIKSKHKMSVGDSQEDNRHTRSSKKLIPQKEVNQESHSGHDKGHTLPLLLSDEDLKVNHENETVNASHSSNTGDKNERENQDIKTDDVPVGASNVSCTENIQNKTSVIIKDEETHTQSSDEIQHEEEMNLPGEINQPIDSNVDDGSFSALDGSNIHELRYQNDNTLDATKEHNNLADLIKQDEVKVADNKERKPISQKKKYCDVVDASTQYSVPLSENSWQPFRPKSRMSKKPPPPRLVIEAEKTGTMKQEKQTTFIKTKSLTPIETPSEIFESPFHGVPKLLQHEFEKQDNSKVLSLSDLKSDNDNTCVSQSIAMPNDNTLDDVTLPDSLHVSDLEEDLQYTSSIRRNEIEKLDRESAPNKERKINPTKLNQDHSKQADRATSIQVRPIFIQSGHMQITNKKDDQPKNTSGHTQVLKLLTLPKAQPSEHNEVTTEQYQPLMLKKIPFQFLQNKHLPKNTIQTTEHQSRNVNGQKHLKTVNFESGLPNDIGYERITLLKVPLFAPTQRAVQEKKQLKLLDPQKVFSFPDGKLKSKKLTQLIVPLKSLKGMPHKTKKIEIPESEEKDKENTNYIVPDKTTKSVLRLHNENPKRLFADKECETEDISVPFVPSCKIDKACQHSIPRPHVNTIETQTLNDFQNELTNIPKVQCPVQIVNVDALKEIDQCKVKTNQIYNNDRAIQNQGYQVRISEPSEEKNPSETNVKIQDKRKLEVETMVSEQGISQDDRKLSGQNQEPSGITIQIQKEMKNSNTQTQEAYPTTNTEKGVQTHTNVSAVSTVSAHQQTHSIMPSVFPTGRSNQMALMLNPPVLNMDKPKHEPRYSKGANVLTEVDIPCDVVQGRLNAIGDKLDQTIYSEELKLATENNSKVEDAINDRHPKFNETITKSDSENQGRFIQRLDDIPHNTQVELSTVLESNSVEIQHDGHSNVQRESVEGNSGLSDIPKSIPNRKQEATLSFDDMLPSNLAGTSIEDPIQAFCEAKITFEELCKYSTQIISLEKHSEKENHVQSIQALEREAEETLQELHQSKHFMSKINVLVKTAEEVESHRSMMCASDKQNRIGAQSTSRASTKNQEWQTTKTLLHETGNSDILLKYIEDAQPKDLTFEVIDDIIKYAGLEEGQKKKSSIETPLLETYTLQNLTNIDDSNLNCNHLSHDRGADKKNQMFSEEHSPKGSPVFHLDLTSLRSDSRNTCVPQHSGKKDHLSALSYEEETLEKRRKIRRWMIEQRQKRRAQTQEVLERNELRGRNLTRVSKNPLPAASARSSLSGRELREHSREREERRSEQRKQFQQKREEEAERLLQDHEEELLTHRELIKKRRSSLGTMGRSMPTLHGNNTKSKVKKLAQGNNTIRIPSSVTKRTAELASLPRGSVSNRKSSHYKRVPGVKQNITLENDKKIQEGIDGLREYIRPTKSTDHSMQVSEDEYKLTYRKTGDNGNQKVNRGIPGKQLGRNGSFSLSLDRISEVDSASSPSLNNGDHLHHVEGDANGEDTSGDISWNVPDEIKMLLYK